MSGIEEVRDQLNGAMEQAHTAINIVKGTEEERNAIHAVLGEMITTAGNIIDTAALLVPRSQRVREGLGGSMLDFSLAEMHLEQATRGTDNNDAKWAGIRYDQAGGPDSALEQLSNKYVLLAEDRLPAILETAEQLSRLLHSAHEVSRRATPHAQDVTSLVSRGDEHIRAYATHLGITLEDS
jgi:hypothetical protein